MSEDAPLQEALDALQAGAQGARRARVLQLQALADRLPQQQPAVRAVLQQKLERAIAQMTQADGRAQGTQGTQSTAAARPATRPPRSALAPLLAHAASNAPAADALRSVSHFRRSWAGSRAQTRVQEAAARAPAQSGPLNSQALVLQALGLMQSLPGDYLRRFVAQAETLLWLEAAGAQAPAEGPGAPARPKKRPPRKA